MRRAGGLAIASSIAIACGHAGPVRDRELAVARCTGLPREAIERTMPDDPHWVVSARAVTEFGGRPYRSRPIGADLVLRHDSLLAREQLEALFACHAARYRAGLAQDAAIRDPLAVDGVDVRVELAMEGHFVLSLRARGDRAAAEIARRAEALAAE